MAEKTAEHQKLIEEAKGLGITSPHLFGLNKLKERIEEKKRVKPDEGGSPENAKQEETATEEKELSPIAASIQRITEKRREDSKGDETENSSDDGSGTTTADSTVKEGDSFLYHETEKPRLFMDGEDVPEGWDIENHKFWKVLDTGKYINVNG